MRRTRYLSLNLKLAFAIIPLILVFMGFNFFVILDHERDILLHETEKRAVSLATGLSILSAEAQRTLSEYQLQQNVYQFSLITDVISVAIFDTDGKILAHNVPQERGKTVEAATLAKSKQSDSERIDYNGRRELQVLAPIILDEKRTGTVQISLSLAGLERALERSQRYLTGLTLILLSGATVFVGLGARWFTGPLLRLALVARELAKGNLSSRARTKQHDEVGLLGNALNYMAARLEGMIEKEKNERQRLQSRVAQLLEFTDRVVGGDLNGQAEAGEDDEMGRLILAVNEMVRHLRIILEDERSVRERLEKSRAELEEANNKLQELDQMKSEFLSTVSHELRTPLTSIKAFAEILLDNVDEDPEMQAEFLGIINKESDRLTRLINNLLDLSRIEAGKMNWHFEPADLEQLCEGACDVLRPAAIKKEVTLVIKHEGEGIPVLADQDKMTQVITNLVGNALKFTPTGGAVTVTTRIIGDRGEVSVRDTGMGIAPEHHMKIFEKFGQVDTTETRVIKGSGLGLPIARSIVEAHRGTLTVDSDVGKGSTFLVRLPLDGSIAESTGPAVPLSIAHQTVLVVDDEPNIRRFLRHILESEGIDVLEAGSGKEALERAVRDKPDLILLDLRLPDMTGFDTLAELKKRPETTDVPVIILSIIQDREQGYRLGASDFLNKPVDRDKLLDRINRLIGSRTQGNLLVVEDDESVRRAIQVMLEHQGYTLRAVDSAEKALEALSEQLPDMILLDLMLPGLSGNDFLMEIKNHQEWADIPVVVLTAAGPDERTQALVQGAKQVLGKPFSESELAELVRKLVGSPEVSALLAKGGVKTGEDEQPA